MSTVDHPHTAAPSTAQRTARALAYAVAILLAVHLVGGLLAIAAGVSTPGEAWGSTAVLAAPLPMVVAQLVLMLAAVRWADRRALVGAGLLALACGVSVISGFFDGALASDELGPGLVAYQVFLLAVTGVVAVLAVGRCVTLVRRRPA